MNTRGLRDFAPRTGSAKRSQQATKCAPQVNSQCRARRENLLTAGVKFRTHPPNVSLARDKEIMNRVCCASLRLGFAARLGHQIATDATMTVPPLAESQSQARVFATTRWSLVLSAGDPTSESYGEALGKLCSTYWYPLYAYTRRRGYRGEEAADLTQEFFARLLEKQFLRSADRERGRFRSFLLTLFKRFLAKEQERGRALKRGGGRQPLSIDIALGEQRFRLEPANEWTAERLYERGWALTLLDSVVTRLGFEFAERSKSRLFELCKPCLMGAEAAPVYAAIAAELGMSETAVRVAVHRMRQRYRELLREEIRHTVETPEDVDDELRTLRSALRGENL
jgi:DNA-directed RNA polymerase specialized sigma24 family protein